MSVINRRKRFVLVPIEIELYDAEDEKDVLGSIKSPTAEEVKAAIEENTFLSRTDATHALKVAGL